MEIADGAQQFMNREKAYEIIIESMRLYQE
jgi:hypothetical protein